MIFARRSFNAAPSSPLRPSPASTSFLSRGTGTEVAALFYSLIESAKLCGVGPKAYLLHATRAALTRPRTATLPLALLNA